MDDWKFRGMSNLVWDTFANRRKREPFKKIEIIEWDTFPGYACWDWRGIRRFKGTYIWCLNEIQKLPYLYIKGD